MHVSKYKKSSGFEKSTLVYFWKGVQSALFSLVSQLLEKFLLEETLQFHNNGFAMIVCPLCKEETSIDANKTTNDFRTNFQIKGIIDAYNTVNKM